jgi:hypothetical protein
MAQLVTELGNAIKLATKKEMTAVFRPNLTSDLTWEDIQDGNGKTILEQYPQTQFYDYTKRLSRIADYANGKLSKNYHLTFSRSENTSDDTVKDILNRGVNVAVVYLDQLPPEDFGAEVLNGDEDDLRFLDAIGKIVGLVYKKTVVKEDNSGFVLDPLSREGV